MSHNDQVRCSVKRKLSLLARPFVRAASWLTFAIGSDSYQTSVAQTGTRHRLRRRRRPRAASSYEHRFPLCCMALVPPGRSGERALNCLIRLASYRGSPGEATTLNYLLNTHAPDQTAERPRFLHCILDLAASSRSDISTDKFS
jgi:hypothetical protein